MPRRHLLHLVAMLSVITTAACGEAPPTNAGPSGGGSGGPPELAVVYGAPTTSNNEPESATFTIEGYSTAMGSQGALVTVGTTTGVYELAASGPTLLPIVGDAPDLPSETGAVRAMVGYESGVLVAAEAGVFFTPGGVLQRSLGAAELAPLGIQAMRARVADDDGDGTAETHLAIRTEQGAYELGGGALVAWTVEGEAGRPTAVLAQKERVYLAYGERVYEIDKASGKAYPLVFDVGFVQAMACGSLACEDGSLVYFASDAGLVERSPSGEYSLYPLAAEGGSATGIDAFALDASKQRLYALAGDWVLRVRAGEVPEIVATLGPAEAPRSLAVDKIGDVWTGEGKTTQKLALGTPLSFLTDVKPIMREYCADCHASGTRGAPKIDFENYDVVLGLVDRVIARVADERSMPPPNYEKKLPADKIGIVKEWAVTKAP
ncbi:hypothetical protein [Polyangium fumosum]|uniref:Cytochrome c domain-containing protein n=1 Tax=Polyangium fumosum TaxID=889272 RepID=A0A4U1JJE5_9BACT|nr:hypothetical protein [Polyangium fumosum]TKD12819.1 hypothetical protein E8A74_03475 [Polyangium fumosum]